MRSAVKKFLVVMLILFAANTANPAANAQGKMALFGIDIDRVNTAAYQH